MTMRRYSWLDQFCIHIDRSVRTLWGVPHRMHKSYPAQEVAENPMTLSEKKHTAGLMRVNHAGEICAQALYQGQALTSRNPSLTQSLQQAALEEGDHLLWCETRLQQLGSHTSYLKPLWHGGSFLLGAVAGLCGDGYSLGFLAETEQQVVNHLQSHRQKLFAHDLRSQAILKQMVEDEAKHRDEAKTAGAKELPEIIKTMMRYTSRFMVKAAYYL